MNTCQHSETSERRRKKSNGVEVIAVQCLQCGSSLREVPKATRNIESLEWFDASIAEKYYASLQNQWQEQQFKEQLERDNRTSEWWQSYKQYLQSEHWQKVREAAIRRDQACQKCFQEWAEQAHHLSYETFTKHGFSFPHECVGICKQCHDELHEDH